MRAVALIASLLMVACSGSEDASEQAQSPVSDVVADDAAVADPQGPAFDLVRISRGGTGVIAGRMSPGSEVQLLANGSVVSSVTADENGEWVIILDQPLTAGTVELNLIAQASDQTRLEAADVVVVSVPERENETFMERDQNGVVAVLTPRSGEGASKVLQRPGVAAFAEVGDSLRVDTIDYGSGQPIVTGQALPRVEVRLYLDDTYVGRAKVDDSGLWAITLDSEIPEGDHLLRVDQTLSSDNVQLRILQPFTAGSPLNTDLAEGGVLVQPGNTLWHIARKLYGSGVRYTVIFRENSEQIADPNRIYPGQLFKLPQDQSDVG